MAFPIVEILMGIGALGGIIQGIQQGGAQKRAERLQRDDFNLRKDQFDFNKKQAGISNLLNERGMQNQTRGVNMNSMDMMATRRDIMRNKSVNNAMYNSMFPKNNQNSMYSKLSKGGY